MPDMLVKLYKLPKFRSEIMEKNGIIISHPLSSDKSRVMEWVRMNFSEDWADECDITFSHQPISTYIAIADGQIAGFASYNAACRNFFGPTGVTKKFRGQGIGEALLIKALTAMKEQGYAYAIIGGVGPVKFYEKSVGAVLIEGSEQGIYSNSLKKD